MKTQPIEPALIDFGPVPASPRYGDVYHPRIGALAQAQHVFLGGNDLPGRWAHRPRFVVLETGFGLGNNFLATWQAWRSDPARCVRLHYVAIERHPARRADLERAHAGSDLAPLARELIDAWPALTPNLHALDFDGGAVQLLLALGDVATLLPTLRVQADALYLDGFAPARNPEMWQPRVLRALGRRAAPGATLATWTVAREVREGLSAAGFAIERAAGIGGKREISVGRWAPQYTPRALPEAAAAGRHAIVVGAGLAGAAVAQALARLGLEVTVLERRDSPAAEGSGNPAGIFHGTVHADDGPYARLYRAAALQAERSHRAACAAGVPGRVDGLIQLDTHASGLAAMARLLQLQGLPPQYLRAVSAQEASDLAGVALGADAWHYPGGGWIAPPAWVGLALAQPGVRLVCGIEVDRLLPCDGQWRLCDRAGRVVAQAPLVVLANATGASRLLAPLGYAPWPLSQTRGQVTHWDAGTPTPLRRPVSGDGYVLPGPRGGLLCGATRDPATPSGSAEDIEVRQADHLRNLARLRALTGLLPPSDSAHWQGRTGWRLHSDDRLPVVGALPLVAAPPGQRQDQARLLPRSRGLFVFTALGARGLTLAPLLARLVAAQATGSPWPLEQELADAIDPVRWIVRRARAGAGRAAAQPADG